MYVCEICRQDVSSDNCFVLKKCLHIFCHKCLHDHIRDNLDARIKCPQENCRKHISDSIIRKCLSNEQIQMYERACFFATSTGYKKCLTPDCPNYFMIEDDMTIFQCNYCDIINCFKSNKRIHPKDFENIQQTEDLEKQPTERQSGSDRASEIIRDIIQITDYLTCSICLAIFGEAYSLSCGHTFCKQCIDKWYKAKDTCPYCGMDAEKVAQNIALGGIIDYIKDLTKEPSSRKSNLERDFYEEFEGIPESLTCSICQEIYKDAQFLSCGHTFCKKCIDQWLETHDTCPCCRIKTVKVEKNLSYENIILYWDPEKLATEGKSDSGSDLFEGVKEYLLCYICRKDSNDLWLLSCGHTSCKQCISGSCTCGGNLIKNVEKDFTLKSIIAYFKNDIDNYAKEAMKRRKKEALQILFERDEYLESPESFKCNLECCKFVLPRSGIMLRQCYHSFCRNCFENFIRRTDHMKDLKCPSCKIGIDDRDVMNAIGSVALKNMILLEAIPKEEDRNNLGLLERLSYALEYETDECKKWNELNEIMRSIIENKLIDDQKLFLKRKKFILKTYCDQFTERIINKLKEKKSFDKTERYIINGFCNFLNIIGKIFPSSKYHKLKSDIYLKIFIYLKELKEFVHDNIYAVRIAEIFLYCICNVLKAERLSSNPSGFNDTVNDMGKENFYEVLREFYDCPTSESIKLAVAVASASFLIMDVIDIKENDVQQIQKYLKETVKKMEAINTNEYHGFSEEEINIAINHCLLSNIKLFFERETDQYEKLDQLNRDLCEVFETSLIKKDYFTDVVLTIVTRILSLFEDPMKNIDETYNNRIIGKFTRRESFNKSDRALVNIFCNSLNIIGQNSSSNLWPKFEFDIYKIIFIYLNDLEEFVHTNIYAVRIIEVLLYCLCNLLENKSCQYEFINAHSNRKRRDKDSKDSNVILRYYRRSSTSESIKLAAAVSLASIHDNLQILDNDTEREIQRYLKEVVENMNKLDVKEYRGFSFHEISNVIEKNPIESNIH